MTKEEKEKDDKDDWISVSDRLPKEYGGYLVYENGFRFVACFHVDNFVDENMLIVKPTHWMLLPEPPKDK